MRYFVLISILVLCYSCKESETKNKRIRTIAAVEFEHLLQDSLLSVRALEINEGRAVVATSNGDVYRDVGFEGFFEKGNYWEFTPDSLMNNNFRSVAFQGDKTFVLSIGDPAKLFYDGSLVYFENHEKIFYDSMNFWNDEEGIAIGDPTEGCMSVIITRDGGNTWQKLACEDLPKAKEGEAAFAASDTNIAIVDNHTWVATGGKSSRVLYSSDKGYTWQVYDTPIAQGKETTGMYSIDFYDELNGFAIGGDYTKPEANTANKIRTVDGGKTWDIVGANEEPGYRSCVQYVPNSRGKELVVVGFKGIDYSNDAGITWKHLSDEGYYTIRFLNDSIAYAAGKGRVSKLTFRE